jgi:hypothetical protein
MRYSLVALTLAALTSHAWAEDEYTAKSLFFSESDAVVAVGTSQKPSGDNAAVASAQGASDASVSATSSGKVIKVAHKKKQVAQLGVSYFIRLKDSDGSTQDVLARRVFKSGERFQLGVKVNRPAYVYILNEAPDGTVTQIYPQPAQDNFVDAMGVVFFPAKGSFVFDSKPGMEKLMVFLSAYPPCCTRPRFESRSADDCRRWLVRRCAGCHNRCSRPGFRCRRAAATCERVQ